MRDNRNPLCLRGSTQLGAILETSAASPASFECVVSDVWSSIGALLVKCYGSDLNSVVEALESILVVDDILSYAPFLSQGSLTTTTTDQEKYAFIVRRIALLRHAVLREGSPVSASHTIDDANLEVCDVHVYLKRANRFGAANNIRETKTAAFSLLTSSKKGRRNSAGSLEHVLQTMCGSDSHCGSVRPLPALYDLDPLLT
ncbi:hypothetical protein SARC_06988 [Sphaeroforma arctica JP610]|uniref:Uncharacterized protein n=1 Tax=Sphaeroforma arctica JP610 TaxID=667725 RepID=A0A0L0FVL1_9EUKA|nr:hypothetical protein SARC_06988 [Sphaeroforma arctica JP610]KNC80674.1 hypothetical protein SARC_06988 [Sphaeroforma arctica JP610]|eukprot:XP_014154576.1 hypothetical protein SARC_06988 [Sphaeroforma arctica JP610]